MASECGPIRPRGRGMNQVKSSIDYYNCDLGFDFNFAERNLLVFGQ